MTRNLVVCCDGTWNTPVQTDRGRVVPTNVVKMARALDLDGTNPPQLLYYDTGIGTGEGLDHWTGGAFGIGLTQNIIQAYRWLADTYQDEDQLYLFGFSRGAYTVRSLGGLVSRCGLAPAGDQSGAEKAYALYREGDKADTEKFRSKPEQRRPRIHFIGVWDTVGALGVPALSRYGLLRKAVRLLARSSKYAHGFHDQTLSGNVDHAYHALAIDERRGPFEPALWHKDPTGTAHDPRKVQQVWFCGVHSNVGGGYVDPGLSDHTLMWMVKKARQAGIRLDDMYLALRLDPNCHGELRDSLTAAYRAIPKHERRVGLAETLNEFVHKSVVDRACNVTNSYRPSNALREKPAGTGKWEALAEVTEDGIDMVKAIRNANSALKTWHKAK